MRVEVYDIDDEKDMMNFSKQDLIGTCEFLLSDAIRVKDQIWKTALLNPRRPKNGNVILKMEQLSKKMTGDLVKLVFEAEFNRRQNNFFRLLRAKDNNSAEFIPVYQSESAVYSGNYARWRPVRVAAAGLMRDNPSHPLALELYEYKRNGNHLMLAKFQFNFTQLVESTKWSGVFGIYLDIT